MHMQDKNCILNRKEFSANKKSGEGFLLLI